VDWTRYREDRLDPLVLEQLPPTLELPALPHAVATFLQRVDLPDVRIPDLSAILETDAGLVVELLRYVNSSSIGLRSRASSVLQALTLLGLKRSKTFVLTTGMQAAVRSRKSRLIHQENFWNASLQKALFAQQVARRLGANPELSFAGSLLQDYLLPVLTNEYHEEYLGFLSDRSRYPGSLADFEQACFGWDHSTAGAALAHRWHFPEELVCCLLAHHDGLKPLADLELRQTPIAAVALSAMLPGQLQQKKNGLQILRQLEAKWAAFDLGALADEVDELHDSMGLGVRNNFPLRRRVEALETVPDRSSVLTPAVRNQLQPV